MKLGNKSQRFFYTRHRASSENRLLSDTSPSNKNNPCTISQLLASTLNPPYTIHLYNTIAPPFSALSRDSARRKNRPVIIFARAELHNAGESGYPVDWRLSCSSSSRLHFSRRHIFEEEARTRGSIQLLSIVEIFKSDFTPEIARAAIVRIYSGESN